jgi:hypothetical protein
VGDPGVTVPVPKDEAEGVNETDGLPDTDLVLVKVTVPELLLEGDPDVV